MQKEELEDFKKTAEQIIKEAGALLVELKNSFTITKQKAGIDIATSADYASEELIVNALKKAYPSHSILTEENESVDNASDFCWIIDPLDGTKEYVRNVGQYGVLMGLEYKSKLELGLFYQPELNRLYEGGPLLPSKLNGKEIHLSEEKDLHKSFVYLPLANSRMHEPLLVSYLALLKQLIKKTYRVRNTPWDAEALCFVAMGACEGYILPTTGAWENGHWWDFAPGIALVEGAGGMVTDLRGKPLVSRDLNHGIVASNGKIHAELLELTKDIV